jgi:ubiquinol-cytochrome c reductase iron-sulfur subunit
MSDQKKGCGCSERRNLLLATSAVGGAAVVACAVPFVASLAPSEKAKAIGAPVLADISKLSPGEKMTVKWRGKPVWILRRTPEMLASLEAAKGNPRDPDSKKAHQPKYIKNTVRAVKDEYFVAIGICTHLGCSPSDKFKTGSAEGMAADWPGGFICPCHGTLFDLAGRVLAGPAPTSLEIPPHKYISETAILIGEDPTDSKGA